ncbi:hypothetical protein PTKIN_Ptkin13bG0236500 [Pterospermum kingtungense]
MAMQTLYLKEHNGIAHNPMGQLSSVPSSLPWWTTLGPPSVYGDPCGQLKPLLMEHPSSGDQVTSTKQELMNKGNPAQFTIFPGDCKNSRDGQGPPAFISLQSDPSEDRPGLELGFRQPMVFAKYPYMDQCYGVFSTYGHQNSGRVMLPLNLTTEDGPIYVNAKQYNGIIRRRQSRAKAVLENKVTKGRKPYMHYSRHLHAMRRPRGSGGRFLNRKSSNSGADGMEINKAAEGQVSQPTGSTEVTSMYSRGDLDHFQINHLGLSVNSFSVMMDNVNGRGTGMPTKWVATADHNCCNLKV